MIRIRRHTLLQQIRRMEEEEAIDRAAKHIRLLETGSWPHWLDYEAVTERADERAALQLLDTQRRKDLRMLAKTGQKDAFDAWWAHTKNIIRHRLSASSSDSMDYWRFVTITLLNARLCVMQDDDPIPSHFPIVPYSDQTLNDLLDLWVEKIDIIPLRDLLYNLEAQVMQAVIYDELARNTHALPVDEPMLGAAWRQALVEEMAIEGAWLTQGLLWPVTKLMKVHGDGHSSAGLLAMMETTDRLEKDIATIGGEAWIQIMEDNRIHRFYRFEDGWYEGDSTGWMRLSVRAALVLAMSYDGSLLVERRRAMTQDGLPVRDVYAASLHDETWGWLEKDQNRSVHLYSFEDGTPMPRDPGKVYRGFFEDYPQPNERDT